MAGMSETPLPLSIVARRLRVPVGWLRAEAQAGRIPHLKAGRQILLHPEAVQKVLAERAKQEGVTHGR
jgi:excisionase family DNA binding protein